MHRDGVTTLHLRALADDEVVNLELALRGGRHWLLRLG